MIVSDTAKLAHPTAIPVIVRVAVPMPATVNGGPHVAPAAVAAANVPTPVVTVSVSPARSTGAKLSVRVQVAMPPDTVGQAFVDVIVTAAACAVWVASVPAPAMAMNASKAPNHANLRILNVSS